MEIELLEADEDGAWDSFLTTTTSALVYHCTRYRDFILDVVPGAVARYLVARSQGDTLGVMPLMMSAEQGGVVNALPFYGSNGAPVVNTEGGDAVREALVRHAVALSERVEAVAMTVVENPFEDNRVFDTLADLFDPTLGEVRIGQVKRLPEETTAAGAEEALMASLHQKTRNMVRKGRRSGFEIGVEDSDESWSALARIHRENIEAIGGQAKPVAVFEAIRRRFPAHDGRRIYVARRNGEIASALLMLYFNGVAEYYTPVIDQRFRNQQPLSAIIFEAMRDATLAGNRWWNWGGTWIGQTSLHRFKDRWGSEDRSYHYHTKVRATRLFDSTSEALRAEYPYFFVLPFSALAGGESGQRQ